MAGSVHPNCICEDLQCPRHGLCAACHTFHAAAGTLPKCERKPADDSAAKPTVGTDTADIAAEVV